MERTETQMKILEVGKKEFLEKGFKDASLNKIVAEAGFTKGAFYGYYPDKAALFEDLVDGAAKGLLEQFKAAQAAHFDLVSEEKTKDSLKLSTEYLDVYKRQLRRCWQRSAEGANLRRSSIARSSRPYPTQSGRDVYKRQVL